MHRPSTFPSRTNRLKLETKLNYNYHIVYLYVQVVEIMQTRTSLRGVLITLAVTILLFGVNVSGQDNLFFVEATEAQDAEIGKRTIEIDANGNIFASFGPVLMKMSMDHTVLEQRVFSSEIIATSISPDYTKLAVTLRASSIGTDTIHVLSTSDLSSLSSNDVTGSNANELQWSPSGAQLYTNAPDTGFLQLNRDSLEQDNIFSGNHTAPLVCLDVSYSSGSILSADENGIVHLWNKEGDEIHQQTVSNSPILDCKIGNEDQFFAISTSDNGIRQWTFSGTELKQIEINGVKKFEFEEQSDSIFMHTTNRFHQISEYDSQTESILNQFTIFHEFDDYVIVLNELNKIDYVFFNSNVDYVVKYAREIQREGFGTSGLDTDGDGVPDSIDRDIDGDGIENNWDLNCLDVGIECKLLPDENFIRMIDLFVNETHVNVKQTFTLNKSHSANIRDLARYSLDDDIRLTANETQHFADTICMNIENQMSSEFISSQVIFSNSSLSFEKSTCQIESGMTLTPANDQTTHIRYSINYLYSTNDIQTIDGLSVQLSNHRFPSSGSITELSEQHPLLVQIKGNSVITQKYVPWHVQEEEISFILRTTSSEEETITPESIFSSPLTYITLLIGIIIIGIVTQKLYDQFTKSEYNIELEDEDDSLYVEDEFDEQTEMNDLEPSEEIEMVNENRVVKKKITPKTSKRVSVRKETTNDAQRILQESSNEVVRKRRARRSEQDTVVTKRRKLSDSINDSEPKPLKRRTVRKSVRGDEEMEETLKRFVSDSPKE